MKSKFEEFYYEDDKNYPVDVYWDLYDKNHAEAIRKYEGHIFCPLCRLAPLTVAKGNERRYFKVVESDMDKHDIDCSYRRKKAGKDNIYYKLLHLVLGLPYYRYIQSNPYNYRTLFPP